MRDFADYQRLHTLHDSARSLVLRVVDRQSGDNRVLKIARDDSPGETPRSQLIQMEFERLQSLNHPQIVKVHDLVQTPLGLGYTMDDIDGSALAQELDTLPTDPRERLQLLLPLALALADALQGVHRAGYSHRDVTPANIVWNRAQHHLRLIDFGLSGLDIEQPGEYQPMGSPEGTLRYLAPEQTGRIGRPVDHRSDLYSLGATLYHLVCGQPPFVSSDYAELVHAHIARTPQPACQRNPAVPRMVSLVLDKLLAKAPEDRYQSAQSVLSDLQYCLLQWQAGQDDPDFVAGRHDHPTRLILPQRLYGCETELAQLQRAIDAAAAGQAQRVLISGEPGAGKSFLINACRGAVEQHRGWLVQGKFDLPQYQQPYAAIHPLCRQLVLRVLAEDPHSVQQLRSRLQAQLGSQAQELQQVLPELQPLLGEGKPAPGEPSAGFQSRVAQAFQTLVRLLQQDNPPLVLFIDDLQWADHASLSLLDTLTQDPECRHLCLVLACRSDAFVTGSQVQTFWQQLTHGRDGQAVGTTALALAPLSASAIGQWLADALRCPPAAVQSLTHIVRRKTGGNPFFIRQFMGLASERQLFHYQDGWQWQDSAVEALTATDNVIELTIAHLQTLPDATCRLLGCAASRGNTCELALLAQASDIEPVALGPLLQPALDAGVIALHGEHLRFAHDRITESLQTLYKGPQRDSWHARLGQLLAVRACDQPQQLIAAVNQLNLGTDQLPPDWLARLPALNRQAAAAALRANAFDLAATLYAKAASLGTVDAWTQQHADTVALHLDWAQAAFQAAQYPRAEALFATLHQQVQALDDRVRLATCEILYFEKTNRFQEAIEVSQQLLAALGVVIPAPHDIDGPRSMAQLQRLQAHLDRVGLDQLAALPAAREPRIINAIDLLMSVTVPYWNIYPHAFPYVVMEAACLSLEHGTAESTPSALAFTSAAVCGAFQQYELGYRLGQATLQLPGDASRYHECHRQFMFHNMVRIYRDPPTSGMPELLDACHQGIEAGNRQWASYCINHYCLRGLLAGLPLTQVQRAQAQLAPAMHRLQQEDAYGLFDSVRQAVVQLQMPACDPHRLRGEFFDETQALPAYQASGHFAAIGLAVTCKLLMLLVCDEWEAAAALATEHEALLNAPTGQLQTEFGLACAALAWLQASPADADRLHRARGVIDRLGALAQHNPLGMAPLHQLLLAVLHDAENHPELAAPAYDRAADAAAAIGMLHWSGLCNGLAARHWLARGYQRAAAGYLLEAQQAWRKWGMLHKVRALQQAYPQWLGAASLTSKISATAGSTTPGIGISGSQPFDALDFSAVVKMGQAIAAELVLDKLLTSLLRLAMENAGAAAGSLLLSVDAQLLLAARGDAATGMPETLRPYQAPAGLPQAALQYCASTQTPLLVDDMAHDPALGVQGFTGALLVIPLVVKQHLQGLIVLTHPRLPSAFQSQHLTLLQLLSSQMAIALDHALLYQEMEQRVQARTETLEQTNQELGSALASVKAMQGELIRAGKLAALGSLVAGIAHELNTPLGNSLLYASTLEVKTLAFEKKLEENTLSRSELRSYLDAAREASTMVIRGLDTAANLVTSFKQLAVDQTHDGLYAFNLKTVLQPLAAAYGPALRKLPFQLHMDIADDVVMTTYAGSLEQVITHFINNALTHAFAGRTEGRMTLSARRAGDSRVQLIFADDGNGMAADVLPRIFDPFFSTRFGEGGSGLGLHIVYNIVTMILDGSVSASSQPGEGSTFVVDIPLVVAEKHPAA